MKMKVPAAILALACASVFAQPSQASDLLINGNLNLDADVNNLPDGWTNWMFGPTAFAAYKNDPANDPFDRDATPYVNAGNYGEWWSSGGGWFQVNPGTAGTAYTFSADSGTEDWDNIAGEIRLIWLDVDSVVISQDVLHTADFEPNKPWANYSLTATAPANTTQVKVEFATWGARGAMLWDNANLVQAHVWNVDAGGNFADAGNWLGGAPGGAGSVAQFNSAITATQTVSVASSVVLGEVRFNNSQSYVLSGAGDITLQDPAGTTGVSAQSGSHTIDVPLNLSQDATFNTAGTATINVTKLQPTASSITKTGGGTLVLNNVRAAALNVNGGTVKAAANGGDNGASRVTTLAIAGGATPTATLDLTDNDLVVTSGSYADITAQIAHARNAGAWDQPGLTSSAAGAATPKNKTLGTLTGAEFHAAQGAGALFNGFTVAGSDILVKYTYYGDTDFNGLVDFDDYSRIDSGFNNNRTGWSNGDVDYNGIVDFDDYSLIDQAFNTQSGTLRRAMSYLDGSDRSDTGMDAPALQFVMNHFQQFGKQYATGFLNSVPEPTSALMLSGLAALAARKRSRRNVK
ncbi:MAG: PEP-CTERM sorting domain-containing protein [Anaerolineae bacterium]|nr:PEP-CTERM sorting domain-containing protein [Phycisphaerae bacterium]